MKVTSRSRSLASFRLAHLLCRPLWPMDVFIHAVILFIDVLTQKRNWLYLLFRAILSIAMTAWLLTPSKRRLQKSNACGQRCRTTLIRSSDGQLSCMTARIINRYVCPGERQHWTLSTTNTQIFRAAMLKLL